jgi:alpha-L-arabinofuranosidase
MEFDTRVSNINGTILTHKIRNGFNYLNNQTAIVPKTLELGRANGTTWEWGVPPASIVVLEFALGG